MAATVRPEVDPSKIKKEKEDSDLRCEKSESGFSHIYFFWQKITIE